MRKVLLILVSLIICITAQAQFGVSKYSTIVNNNELRLRRSAVGDVVYNIVTGASFEITADSIAGYSNDTTAVIPTASGHYARLQYRPYNSYRQSWFGVTTTKADSISNRIAIQKMFDYVGATGNPVVQCDQTDTVWVRIEHNVPITFPYAGKSLHMIGVDTLSTIYKVLPEDFTPSGSNNAELYSFDQTANGNQCGPTVFTNAQYIMPLDYSTVSLPGNISWWACVAGGFNLTCDRMRITGGGKQVIYSGGANTDDGNTSRTITLIDSYVHANEGGSHNAVAIQYTGGRWYNYLHAYNTTFSGSGGTGHQLYVQPWLNWYFENCRFGDRYFGGSSQLFQSNQTLAGTWDPDPTVAWVPTEYQTMINCTFLKSIAGSYEAFNLDKDYFPGVELINCKFYNNGRATLCKNYLKLSGCSFMGLTSVTFSVDPGDAVIQMDNCYLERSVFQISGGGNKKNVSASITNCHFETSTTSNLLDVVLADPDSHTVNIKFVGNVVRNTGSTWAFYLGNNVGGTVGTYYLADNYFEGQMLLFRDAGPNEWIFRDNIWANTNNFYDRIDTTTDSAGGTLRLEVHNMKLPAHKLNTAMTSYGIVSDAMDSLHATKRLRWFTSNDTYDWGNPIIQTDGSIDSLCAWYNHYYINVNGKDTLHRIALYEEAASFIQGWTSDNYWGKYWAGPMYLTFDDSVALSITPQTPTTAAGHNIDTLLGRPVYDALPNERVTFEFDRFKDRWDCTSCARGTYSMGDGGLDGLLAGDWRMAYLVGYNADVVRDIFSRNPPMIPPDMPRQEFRPALATLEDDDSKPILLYKAK